MTQVFFRMNSRKFWPNFAPQLSLSRCLNICQPTYKINILVPSQHTWALFICSAKLGGYIFAWFSVTTVFSEWIAERFGQILHLSCSFQNVWISSNHLTKSTFECYLTVYMCFVLTLMSPVRTKHVPVDTYKYLMYM